MSNKKADVTLPTPEEIAEWNRRSEEAKAHPETLLSLEQVRDLWSPTTDKSKARP